MRRLETSLNVARGSLTDMGRQQVVEAVVGDLSLLRQK